MMIDDNIGYWTQKFQDNVTVKMCTKSTPSAEPVMDLHGIVHCHTVCSVEIHH